VLQPLARNRLALSRPGAFLQALEDVQGSSYVCQLLGHGKLLCRDQQERTFIAMQACGAVCQRSYHVLTLSFHSESVRRWATCARRRTRSASRGRRRELYAHALSPTRPALSNRKRR